MDIKRSRRWVITLFLFALLAAGCGGPNSPLNGTPGNAFRYKPEQRQAVADAKTMRVIVQVVKVKTLGTPDSVEIPQLPFRKRAADLLALADIVVTDEQSGAASREGTPSADQVTLTIYAEVHPQGSNYQHPTLKVNQFVVTDPVIAGYLIFSSPKMGELRRWFGDRAAGIPREVSVSPGGLLWDTSPYWERAFERCEFGPTLLETLREFKGNAPVSAAVNSPDPKIRRVAERVKQ